MNLLTLTATQLRRAADIKDQLAKLELEFRVLVEPASIPAKANLSASADAATLARESRKATHRARHARAMRKYWKKRKALEALKNGQNGDHRPRRSAPRKWTEQRRAKYKATMQARGYHHAQESH